jgi:hypothetical protein
MLKTFLDRFFHDNITLASPTLDEGSKRLGKTLSILIAGGWCVFLLGVVAFSEPIKSGKQLGIFLTYQVGGVVGAWVLYRIIRAIFWVIDGFRSPKG